MSLDTHALIDFLHPPCATLPLLHVASAGGAAGMHRRHRRAAEEPEIIDRLWENTRFFKSGLEALGFNTGVSEADHAVITGDGAWR
jgi:7-keto-8-aminopelargonate synthetase-like enzyme